MVVDKNAFLAAIGGTRKICSVRVFRSLTHYQTLIEPVAGEVY
jgi:hypothetical protein